MKVNHNGDDVFIAWKPDGGKAAERLKTWPSEELKQI
jgi:hypothetical protein